MRAQVNRVGAAWDLLETVVLPGTKDIKGNVFVKRNIKKEWEDWMTQWHKDRLDNLQQAIQEKVQVFWDNPSVQITKRWDYGGLFGRKPPAGPKVFKPKCGSEKDNNKMKYRVDLLKGFQKGLPAIQSELKLD